MEDIRGMAEEGIDFGGITKNWKPIAIVVVGLALIALLGYLALGVVNPEPITMVFEEDVISAGKSTTLKVAVTNTGEIDAKNVTIQIEPESGVIIVTDLTLRGLAKKYKTSYQNVCNIHAEFLQESE